MCGGESPNLLDYELHNFIAIVKLGTFDGPHRRKQYQSGSLIAAYSSSVRAGEMFM